jgi:hypothetical protein
MTIIYKRDENDLEANSQHFTVTNEVRNEIDPNPINRRRLHDFSEVVKSVVNGQWGKPYMPRKFPKGTWTITAIVPTTEAVFAPVKIETDAHQMVETWALDANGGYDHADGGHVEDSGYYLHWSEGSRTTHGCGRVGTDTDIQIRALANVVNAGDTLEVV